MRTSIRTAPAGIALSLALTASPSLAQGDLVPGDITLSGYVQGVTDYRFRGLSASGGDPAVQGTINANHSSGFYVGAWASSIDDGGTDILGELELDLYAGWTGEVSPGFTLDVGMLRYVY
ncbi:MAG TPA: TorF family putative porin, partial [Woeseiaceae bacterium]|nr:TorF family putative porin [Woeseiaceae bacterium]